MSKKIKAEATIDATNMTLEQLMTDHPYASLRKLAQVAEVSYPALLRASKKPVEGEVYDPNATNWLAVSLIFSKADIDINALDWDAINTPNASTAKLPKDMNNFPIGCEVYLRRNATVPYVVVYKTETHIVLQLKGTQEPLSWSNSTFLLNGPQFEPRVESKQVSIEPDGVAKEEAPSEE